MLAPTMTVEERRQAGQAARKRLPRSEMGAWSPAEGRADPIAILEAQAASRVQDLVPLRYERMMASPFTFYRGAAAVMAADLGARPNTGLTVQLCGDAHLSNFGIFASPDRRLVFDVNDFDETHPGPFEWDLLRLVASLEVAGRTKDLGGKQRRALVTAAVESYRAAMQDLATKTGLAVWYARVDVEERLAEWIKLGLADAQQVRKAMGKAQGKDNQRAFDRLVTRSGGQVRFISDPPVMVPIAELFPEVADRDGLTEQLQGVIRSYRTTLASDRRHLLDGYTLTDVARRVVGVGSVGTRAWIALLLGVDDRDPLILQFKEAQPSVLEPYTKRSRYANHGKRVVEGQRLMQAASDVFLGWDRIPDLQGVEHDFYVRQLWDGKFSASVDIMPPARLTAYAQECAWTLARAHARSGDRIAIASYLGRSASLAASLVTFATTYADQNEKDHKAMLAAVASGRLPTP